MNTDDPKPWWRSRTLIGALVVMLAQLARLVWPEVEIDVEATMDALTSVVELAGLALVAWGRIRARRPIRLRRTADPGPVRVRELSPNTEHPAGVSSPADPNHGGDEFNYLGGFRSD